MFYVVLAVRTLTRTDKIGTWTCSQQVPMFNIEAVSHEEATAKAKLILPDCESIDVSEQSEIGYLGGPPEEKPAPETDLKPLREKPAQVFVNGACDTYTGDNAPEALCSVCDFPRRDHR